MQNHEGKLKDWDKFIDCRVKIEREQVKSTNKKAGLTSRNWSDSSISLDEWQIKES